jgi:hypothetical protein
MIQLYQVSGVYNKQHLNCFVLTLIHNARKDPGTATGCISLDYSCLLCSAWQLVVRCAQALFLSADTKIS